MNGLDKRQIANSFGRAAPAYEQNAVLQKTVAERLLTRLDLLTIKPGWIADIGSGTGSTSRALAGRYKSARVAQIDLSPPMLLQSRSKSRKFFSRQYYCCADAEKIPMAAHKIDLAFSSLTYQWCNDLDRAVVEVKRVLRPNGLFLFATLGPDTLRELRVSWAVVDDATHVNTFFDMHDIGDALVRAGLESVVMDVEIITLNYPDCLSLMRDIKIVGAHNINQARLKALTGKQKMQRMIAAYEKFRRDNLLPATYEIVYGHAWAPAQDRPAKQDTVAYIPVESLRKTRDRK
jgi:malonyl-CoA O-methyltransferase